MTPRRSSAEAKTTSDRTGSDASTAASTTNVRRIKCCPPGERPGALRRERLESWFRTDALLPVTLIAAPGGYGKTTLAADAARSLSAPWRSAWLTLDAEDANPLRLMQGLVTALSEIDASLVQPTATLLATPQNLPPRDVMLQCCDDLASASQPVVLVLDNWQRVDSEPANALIEALVDHMPGDVRLVIVSRQIPTLPLAAWRARGILREVDKESLRFTADETARFLQQTMSLTLPEEISGVLSEHVEGWPAGLQMAALSIQHRSQKPYTCDPVSLALEFCGRHSFVMEYMTQQVLSALSPGLHAFLRASSMLQALSPGVCDAITGRHDSAAVLQHLEQANLFVSRLDDERRWYRMHALLQEFLVSGMDPQEIGALHAKAAVWFEAHGMHAEAFHHAWQADDLAACARVMLPLFEELLCAGEARALEQMFAKLPYSAFESFPTLALQQAWLLYLTSSADRARQFLPLARLDEESAHPHQARGALATFKAYLSLNWGDASATEGWANKAIEILPASSSYLRVLVQIYLGQAQTLLGQRAEALATLRRAYHLGQQVGNHAKSMDALVHLVLLLLDQGRALQARDIAGEAIARYRDRQGRPLPVAGLAHTAMGVLHLAANELDSALACLETGARLTERVGVLYFVLLSRCFHAQALHAAGREDEAWSVIAAAREKAEGAGGQRRRRMVEQTVITLMMREGHAAAAARLLPAVPAAIANGPATDADTLLEARVRVGQRRFDAALRLLAPLEAAARRDAFDGCLVQIQVLQSLCHQAQGKRQAALRALEQALSLASVPRLRKPFVDAAESLQPLLDELRPVAPAFVASLQSSDRSVHWPPAIEAAPAQVMAPLSQRDVDLLHLINRGLRNSEIAGELSITVGTTKQYVNQLFAKLGARNRVEAILLARRLRVLP